MPPQYRHPGHTFETGMNRLPYMAPAVVPALGSDPENTIRVRCQNNGIPANLRTEASSNQGEEQRNRHIEPDLNNKLMEKSDAPSTLATRADSSNPDVQEVTEDQNNNLSEDNPLLPAPVGFANINRRFSTGLRGKQRDKMIALVRNYGEWDLKKKWDSRTGDSELRLHLAEKGVSRDLIRKMSTVSIRKLTKKDYDGICTDATDIFRYTP
jgi:hypothetical protein